MINIEKRLQYWREYGKIYSRSPYGKFRTARKNALKRDISWNLSFDEWFKIWQDSSRWEERGPNGYVMCRKGDCGDYSVNNVFIAHQKQNHSDALINGAAKRHIETGQFISPKLCL